MCTLSRFVKVQSQTGSYKKWILLVILMLLAIPLVAIQALPPRIRSSSIVLIAFNLVFLLLVVEVPAYPFI